MELTPGYKQTEAGMVPINWTVSLLGTVADTSSGTTPPRALHSRYYTNGSVAWVKTMDLANSDLVETDERVTELALEETTLRVYPTGTVLVAMYGGFQQIGRTALLRIPAAVNQAITAVQLRNESLLPEYLLATLNHRVNYWKGVASSSRRDPNITGKDVRQFPIAYPDRAEQSAIATALRDVDGLIDALHELIAKKRDLKKAAMQQLLTGHRRLPGFDDDWEVKRLGDVADIDPETLGSDTPPNYMFNYISLEDVDSGVLRGYSEVTFGSAPSRARRKLQRGDVLVSTVRPNRKSHLLFSIDSQEWICSTGFSVVRCKDGLIHSGYLFFHMFGHEISRQIEGLVTGSNYPAINSADVRGLEIPIPTYQEQAAIASVLTDMDLEVAALEQRRDKTSAIKQGMMQELLTGRTRLV